MNDAELRALLKRPHKDGQLTQRAGEWFVEVRLTDLEEVLSVVEPAEVPSVERIAAALHSPAVLAATDAETTGEFAAALRAELTRETNVKGRWVVHHPTCRHRGWSWFDPLNSGRPRLFCAHCGKWLDQIRSRAAHADAARLLIQLTREVKDGGAR